MLTIQLANAILIDLRKDRPTDFFGINGALTAIPLLVYLNTLNFS